MNEMLKRSFSLQSDFTSNLQALDLKPGDKNCLVARSQCFLQLGDADKALLDANETLEEDPNFIKVGYFGWNRYFNFFQNLLHFF